MILNYSALNLYRAGYSASEILRHEDDLRAHRIITTTAVFEGNATSGACTVSQRIPGGPIECAAPADGVLGERVLKTAHDSVLSGLRDKGVLPRGFFRFTLLTVIGNDRRFWVTVTDEYQSSHSPF